MAPKRRRRPKDAGEQDEVGERKPRSRDNPEQRKWKTNETYDGKKLKNVHFSEEEDARIMRALRLYAEEIGEDLEVMKDSMKTEQGSKRGAFARIAKLADIPRRRTWAIVQRLRRILWGSHKWTESELQILLDEACTKLHPSWKEISSVLGVHPTTCRDKFRDLCKGTRKVGAFSATEDLILRMAICETTNSLLPVSDIPWSEIQKWLPNRGWRSLMQRWYIHLLPQLTAYEDKYGVPIEPEVFVRHMLRRLKKSSATNPKALAWAHVNTWWSADMNRRKWRALSSRVPVELMDASFRERVGYWYQALRCREHKKRDKKMLKCALSTVERKAQEQDHEGHHEAVAPLNQGIQKGEGVLLFRGKRRRAVRT